MAGSSVTFIIFSPGLLADILCMQEEQLLLSLLGVPASQIQAIGHWQSLTFEQYIRCHPTVLQALIFHGRSIHDPPFAAA